MIKKCINWVKSKSRDEISIQTSLDLADLPIITFKQGDKKYNFLLDTGSSCNIIDSNILDTLVYEKVEGEGELVGAEGIIKKAEGCIIRFFYKETFYKYLYLIKDLKDAFSYIKQETGVNLHGIIGTAFFTEYKYVLDFDRLVGYSKK